MHPDENRPHQKKRAADGLAQPLVVIKRKTEPNAPSLYNREVLDSTKNPGWGELLLRIARSRNGLID
jgi:hypothetical protein